MKIAAGGDDTILSAVAASLDDGSGCVVPPAGTSGGDVLGLSCPPAHLVVYSSGSTGIARGILRTHASWLDSIEPFTRLSGIRPDDAVWLPGPMASTLYLFGAVHARHVGAQVLLRGDAKDGATVVHAVPATLRTILADPPPRLRLAVVAGDHCPRQLVRAARDLGIDVLEYYGAAELSFVGWRRDDREFRAFPGTAVAARDGVLWVRSPYLAEGYATTAGPHIAPGPLRREDSWASVGDLGAVEGEGFTVLGRGAAAITVGGHTILVDDVEAVLREAAASDEVAVVGVAHPALGEVVVAVTGRGVTLSATSPDVRTLPAAARPKAWVEVSALPRLPSGKVDRAELRRLAAGRM